MMMEPIARALRRIVPQLDTEIFLLHSQWNHWVLHMVPTGTKDKHIFWDCPEIHIFWREVTDCLTEVLSAPVPFIPRVCLIGLVEEVMPSLAHRTLLNIGLFYGKKAILLKWKNTAAPTLSFWKGLVNSVIPLYKATYRLRGCPKKFSKVWQPWLDSTVTVG